MATRTCSSPIWTTNRTRSTATSARACSRIGPVNSGCSGSASPDSARGSSTTTTTAGSISSVVNGAVRHLAVQARRGDPYPLKQRNQLLRNDAGRRFVDVTAPPGRLRSARRGAGRVDRRSRQRWRLRPGRLQQQRSRSLLRNEVGSRQHWLGVRVIDRPSRTRVQAQGRSRAPRRRTADPARADGRQLLLGQRSARALRARQRQRRRPFACDGPADRSRSSAIWRSIDIGRSRLERRLGERRFQVSGSRVQVLVLGSGSPVPGRTMSGSGCVERVSVEPAKPGLVAVPMPALDGLEAAVADQIREQRQAFEQSDEARARHRRRSGERVQRARPPVSRVRVLRRG